VSRLTEYFLGSALSSSDPGGFDAIDWDDVAEVAPDIFSVWQDSNAELEWARRAWQILSLVGLTRHELEIDRVRACIRFLALGHLYHDWCSIVLDQRESGFLERVTAFAGPLRIDPFYVGQLIGSGFVAEDDSTSYEEALAELVRSERRAVADGLVTVLGGTTQLFLSLWRTTPVSEEDDEPTRASDDDILNSLMSPERLIGYEWVAGGCAVR
jgi:hypothetical protein